jgi:hypothetical protein
MDRYRLSIDLPREHHEKLKYNIPHGLLAVIFRSIVDDMCNMYDKYGQKFTVALMSGTISYEPLVRRFIDINEAGRSKDAIHRNDIR